MRKILFLPLLVIVGFVFSVRAEIPPAEKILPDDTLAVFSIPDCAKSREWNQQSPQMQFWHDPAMKPFTDKFMDKLNSEFITPLERDLGISFTNYTGLAQGQFTFAVVQNGWEGSTNPLPGWIFLLDAKTNSAQLKTNLAQLKQKWTDANKASRSEKIRDVDFTVLLLSSNDIPATLKNFMGKKNKPAPSDADAPADSEPKKDAPPIELYIGQSDSLFIAGGSPKVLERILANLSGGQSATLADQPAFAANSAAMFHDASVIGWVNAKSLVEILNKSLAKDAEENADRPSPIPFSPQKLVAGIGLNGLRTVAFAARPTADGASGQFFLNVPESDRTGIFKILAGEPKETAPPAFVPADAVKVIRWRFGGQKTWETLEKTLSNISPQVLAGLNFFFQSAAKDPDTDVKKAIVSNLGDDLIQYSKAPRGKTLAEITAPPALFLISSPQPDKLLDALKPVLAMSNRRGDPVADRDFLGHKIYSVTLVPAQLKNGEKITDRKLSFVAAAGYVAITMDDAILEEFLRSGDNPAKPLRETPGLADAIQKVSGDGTSLLIYENQRETMRTAFDLYKLLGNSATQPGNALGMITVQNFFKDWCDVSLLPDFDAVAKYFYLSVSAMSANSDGITFKVFAPTPPELKK